MQIISDKPTEEELKGVIKDFSSYFVEQLLKEVKETFTSEEEGTDQTVSQYKDMYVDMAIEQAADVLVDDLGSSYTQQLYEQMKRNYGIE